MAVTTTATDVIYLEDGSTVQFDFNTFTIFEETDLVVTSLVTATTLPNTNYTNGILVLNTDYTVTINADGTGFITKMTALSNLYTLVLQRVLPIEQQISLVDNVGTDAATYEEGYDRLTMIAQQLQAQINRSLLQPITVSTPIAFPAPVASTYLGFDAGGNLTTLSSISVLTITPVSPSVALDIAQVNAGGTNFQYKSLLSLIQGLSSWLNTLAAGAGILPTANLPVGTTSGKIPVLNGSNQIAASLLNIGNGASQILAHDGSGDIADVAWTDYFGSSTIVGWAASPTGNIYYKKIGKLVFVVFYINGTSNAATASFTLPFPFGAPTAGILLAPCFTTDNTSTSGIGIAITSGTQGMSVNQSNSIGSASGWTSSGGKVIEGQFCYQTT